MDFIIRSPLSKGLAAFSALAADWLPERAAPHLRIGDEHTLITSISLDDRVRDALAVGPFTGKQDLSVTTRVGLCFHHCGAGLAPANTLGLSS